MNSGDNHWPGCWSNQRDNWPDSGVRRLGPDSALIHHCARMLRPVQSQDVPRCTPSIVAAVKVGRNAPCPCGSKMKYKKCCGRPEPQSDLHFGGSLLKSNDGSLLVVRGS